MLSNSTPRHYAPFLGAAAFASPCHGLTFALRSELETLQLDRAGSHRFPTHRKSARSLEL